jgi:hypothetical protein
VGWSVSSTGGRNSRDDRHGPGLVLAGDVAPPAREAGSLALADERVVGGYWEEGAGRGRITRMAGARRWFSAGEEDGAAAEHNGQRRMALIAGSLGRPGHHEVREKRRRPPRRCAGGVLPANLMREVYRKGKKKKVKAKNKK